MTAAQQVGGITTVARAFADVIAAVSWGGLHTWPASAEGLAPPCTSPVCCFPGPKISLPKGRTTYADSAVRPPFAPTPQGNATQLLNAIATGALAGCTTCTWRYCLLGWRRCAAMAWTWHTSDAGCAARSWPLVGRDLSPSLNPWPRPCSPVHPTLFSFGIRKVSLP